MKQKSVFQDVLDLATKNREGESNLTISGVSGNRAKAVAMLLGFAHADDEDVSGLLQVSSTYEDNNDTKGRLLITIAHPLELSRTQKFIDDIKFKLFDNPLIHDEDVARENGQKSRVYVVRCNDDDDFDTRQNCMIALSQVHIPGRATIFLFPDKREFHIESSAYETIRDAELGVKKEAEVKKPTTLATHIQLILRGSRRPWDPKSPGLQN